MIIRTVIADDEPLARERIRSLLKGESELEVIAECSNGAQTLNVIQENHPDLLFLDVQMPRLNGFEVLEALPPDQIPLVIFTTAHDEHAIRAFEVSALDYLLKPFTEARFRKALHRARSQLRQGLRQAPGVGALLTHWQTSPGPPRRLLVRSAERILFLRLEEIEHVEAAGNYVVLHVGKERHILRETMAAMEARLGPAGFMRISRSVIVNLSQIRELQPLGPGQFCVLLKNGARLDMTCSLRELQTRLSEL
jgi:two-component system LytT family response regulator